MQKCVTGRFYTSSGHSGSKKPKSVAATSSTDSQAIESTSTPKPLLAKMNQPHPKPKSEPLSESTQRPETSVDYPVCKPVTDSEELDLEATMEDEDLDWFQDKMATAYSTDNPDNDTDTGAPAPSQLIEPKVFITKPPPLKPR